MKSLAFLVFVFFVIPGSGQLVWDGIPLNSRAEVALIVLTTAVVFSRELRLPIRAWLEEFRWRGLLKPALVTLCLLKFISFSWAPMSEGFEACYRSLYSPLEDESECEKSYDGPFLRADGLPLKNASRIDHVVDFGEYPYDWSLPFMNEYPRLGATWLERFPFTATYYAVVENDAQDPRLLPIYGIGELSVTVDGELSERVVSYQRSFMSTVAIPARSSEVIIEYRYRDDESTVPEVRPVPRGPYARLKVGEPMSVAALAEVSRLRITGDLQGAGGVVGEVEVRDTAGGVVEFSDRNAAQAASGAERDPLLAPFDLEIEIPAAAILDGPLTLHATTNGASTLLATITGAPDTLTPRLEPSAGTPLTLTASLTTDRDSLTALTPGVRDTPTLPLRALLALLDLATLAMLGVLAYVLVLTMRTALATALGLAGITWLAVEPLDAILPRIAGGGRELVIPYAIIATLIISLRRHINKYPLPFLLPTATVLATQKVFEHLHYNHPGHSARWWGNLLFYWRDSDWFANNGYARTIFVDGSLRGGEAIFWFQSAPRYLALVTRYLLGENDVLIGLIAVTLGFLCLSALAARFASEHTASSGKILAYVAAFIGLIFLGDQLITAFGFFVSSEYPTWLVIIAITTFLLRSDRESRVWVVTGISAAAAAMVHFRPNNLFVSLALFLVVVILKINYRNREIATRQVGWAASTYLFVLSLNLVHNLFYGDSFVPLTANAPINYAFSWTEIWGSEGLDGSISIIWNQLRALMYWRAPNDPSYAIVFWGAQIAFAIATLARIRSKRIRSSASLYVLLPFTYVAPMLKFQYTSYYPRHLVAASLLCLCSALLMWPQKSDARP